ncbi:MAG: hypothetical protein A2X86_00675 [Bdellovibrionales bacterium GWA2_49_15]|nr:MAG: hypothetical protein A2X86_00675 [Bdellovibrionales bacterium GWA2_49_15]HAZ13221.1 hypothetical protein [Bdellovibrionales bacterium]
MTKAFFLITFLVFSAFSLSQSHALDQQRDEEISNLLERSQATRAEFAKSTPQREIAAVDEQDVARFKEFQKMVEEDDDTPVFGEIDKVIQNE